MLTVTPAGRRRGAAVAAHPLIGITATIGPAGADPWTREAAYVAQPYLDAVSRAGGLPLIVTPAAAADLDPVRYQQERHPQTEPSQPELARDLPLLGICRGMQILNVALGGTLHQHLPEIVGHHLHRANSGFGDGGPAHLEAGSLAAHAAGGDYVASTPSSHHQGVNVLGAGLVASGSADDGSVIVIERPGSGFVLGVQWHPEVDGTSTIVADLVDAARLPRQVQA